MRVRQGDKVVFNWTNVETARDSTHGFERGIPGTAMPAFDFLSSDERRQIAAYILRLADLLDEPEPHPIADPGKPPAAMAEAIAKGKQLYVDAGCASCHGDAGKGDGLSARDLKDEEALRVGSLVMAESAIDLAARARAKLALPRRLHIA